MQTGSDTVVSRASAGRPNFVFDLRRTATCTIFDYGWIGRFSLAAPVEGHPAGKVRASTGHDPRAR